MNRLRLMIAPLQPRQCDQPIGRPTRAICARTLVAILCACALAATPGSTQDSPVAVSPATGTDPSIQSKRWLPVRTDGHSLALPLSVRVGLPEALQEVQAMAGDGPGPWHTVLYLAAPLADTKTVQALAETLSATAAEWVSLGPVSVVVADPFPFVLAGPTQDESEVAEALRYLPDEAVGAGELDEMIARADSQEAIELVSEHADYLMEELATHSFGQAGAAVLLDWPTTARFPLAGDTRDLSVALAAAGWSTWFVTPTPEAPPAAPLHLASDATTGGVVSPPDAVRIVEDLRHRTWAKVDFSAVPDAAPLPLTLIDSTGRSLDHPTWVSAASPPEVLSARGLRALAEPRENRDFPLVAQLSVGSGGSDATVPGRLEIRISPSRALQQARKGLLVALVLPKVDEGPELLTDYVELSPSATTSGWVYQVDLTLPADAQDAAVVIENPATGDWHAVPANLDLSGGSLAPPQPFVVQQGSLGRPPTAPGTTGTSVAGGGGALGAPQPQQQRARSNIIRLLPPRKASVRGNTRFEALSTTPEVAEVAFWLDGQEVFRDNKAPFQGTLDLGQDPSPRTIKAIAYAFDGVRLGQDELVVNAQNNPFTVSITRAVDESPSQRRYEAEVTVPRGRRVVKASFYLNDREINKLDSPPYQVSLDVSSATSSDFVRLLVELDDGSSLEDVWLLTQTVANERIEVNLLEVHVVALDRASRPVNDLTATDFKVTIDGKPQTVERFSVADEVPLLLGLVIDSSESMSVLMTATRKAAAQFLGSTLIQKDQAFIVDFDNRPRMVQTATDELPQLLASLGKLRPDGATALYDALVFSLLEFQETEHRRAVVLLTDGEDYGSEFGPRKTIQYSKRLGVPVYILDLSPILNPRSVRQTDLEGIVEKTGGQIYYIREMSELTDAYAQINAELRSQYVLAISTDRRLDLEQIDNVETEVLRSGIRTRTVVDGRQLN